MKIKTRITISIIAVCCLLLLTAFAMLPRIQLTNNNGKYINLTYLDATFVEDTVTLRVDYSGYGENFEIAKDLNVSIDREFRNKLQMLQCTVEQDTGIYIYEYSLKDYTETLYIEPPILYVPTTTPTVSAALRVGSSVCLVTENEWFTISSVKVDYQSDGLYAVNVLIIPAVDTKLLPRFPKLIYGGSQFGGMSSLNFNQTDEFDFGEFTFIVPTSGEEEIKAIIDNASIKLEQALEMVSANPSSNVLSLSVNEVE